MNYTGGEHGIMAAILAMTAPPTYGNQDSKNKQDKSSGQKKNNRAHIKESFCEGCGDPGEILLACTSCSVCYHPVCDEPPLDEEIVKDLEWKCRCCRNKDVLAEVEKEAAKTVESEPHLQRTVKMEAPELDDKAPEDVPLAKESIHEQIKLKEGSDDQHEICLDEVVHKIVDVFSKVIATAKTINPTPFEIPRSFHLNQYQFPGTSRSQIKKPGGGKSKPTIVDLDNFKVPVPISVCFNCGKSCRLAPLLQCDYCPKQFHFDCLNPPLTSPPVGLWMCPLHVEPFLESKQLKSWQLSKRVRIWDLTHQQIHRSSVVLNFMKKCARKHPPFSSKVPISVAIPYDVPDGSGNYVEKAGVEKRSFSGDPDKVHIVEDEDEASVSSSNRKRKLFKCYENEQSVFSEEPIDVLASDEPSTSKTGRFTQLEEKTDLLNTCEEVSNKTETIQDTPTAPCSSSLITDKRETECSSTGKESSQKNCNANFTGIDLILEAANIDSKKRERRIKFLKSIPIEQVYDLAAQKLEDVDSVWRELKQNAAYNPIGPRITQSAKKGKDSPRPRPIAVHSIQLYCLNVAKVIKFTTQSIVIGSNLTVEPGSTSFNPQVFVNCKRVSGFHAVIFLDRSRMRWEVLNYSPHGLIVDSVQYCLKPVVDREEQPRNDVETIKSLINQRRGILLEKAANPRLQPAEDLYAQDHDCPCKDAVSTVILKVKHEGSATICVGSEIQIGCLKLVVKSIDTEEKAVPSNPSARK